MRVLRVKTPSPLKDTAPREQPAALPVRQAEFRPVVGVLTIDPAGEPVAHEGGVAPGRANRSCAAGSSEISETVNRGEWVVEEGDRGIEIGDDREPDVRPYPPIPIRGRDRRRRRRGPGHASGPRETGGPSSAARDRTMQQTLSVLHTLRSIEFSTAARNRAASAVSSAISQAPPVPCRLTDVPACRAMAPSCATAGPDPRATARASLRSENSAHPADRSALSSRTLPRRPAIPPRPRPGRGRASRWRARCAGRRTRCGKPLCCRPGSPPPRRRRRSADPRTRSRPRPAARRPARPTSRRAPPARPPCPARSAHPARPQVRRSCRAAWRRTPSARRGRSSARERRRQRRRHWRLDLAPDTSRSASFRANRSKKVVIAASEMVAQSHRMPASLEFTASPPGHGPRGHAQQIAALLHHDQSVAGLGKPPPESGGTSATLSPPNGNRRAGRQLGEFRDHREGF